MNTDKLKEIYSKYRLDKEDIFQLKFGNKKKYIVCRSGIEKIKAILNIEVKYTIEKVSDDHKSCIILATGCIFKIDDRGQKVPNLMAQSFGEVSPQNNTNSYSICMAEKRALSRIVLKMSGLFGMYGEDEAEEFKSNG